MYTLYTYPSTAGMVPHILLREIGAPFDVKFLDRSKDEHKSPDYLKLNPNGRVPTLVEDGFAVYETAAICQHLCDRHPEAGLAPGLGTPERARFYQWMAWLSNTIQPDMLTFYYPERLVPAEGAEALKQVAVARIHLNFQLVDAELADRPWLVGDGFGAADAYLFVLARWSRNMSLKARDLPHLGPYLERVFARPAVQQVYAAEELAEPYY